MLKAISATMVVGDDIVTVDSHAGLCIVGKVSSAYIYEPGAALPHHRRVAWAGLVERDALAETTRRSLGSISTVFRLLPDASREVIERVSGASISVAEYLRGAR